MAITSAVTTSFKVEALKGVHNFTADNDQFKLALYTSSATMGAATTAYAIDFGGDKTSTAGSFTIVFPAANATAAIIRLA